MDETTVQEGGERDAAAEQAWDGVVPAAIRQVWRLIVLVVGLTVVAIGVAMIVLPGPAFVVIPAGLAILASEFVWARRLLARVRTSVDLERFWAFTRGRPDEKGQS